MLSLVIRFFTWVSARSDAFCARFLRRIDIVLEYTETYQDRLTEAYDTTTAALIHHGIPFLPATSGLFIFIDLRTWLYLLPGPDLMIPKESSGSSLDQDFTSGSQELQLWKWLVDHGVALNPGEASHPTECEDATSSRLTAP